jgi:peptidoglycan/LPS O-acetylase OafA/YrhL
MLPSAFTRTTPAPRPAADPATGPAAPPSAAPAGARMGWLDALRGLAALIVVVYHLPPYLFGGRPHVFDGWFWSGRYGVLLFFVVSGYVIPMSLERYGNLRRFWIGRLFRIYPAWLLTVLLALAGIALLPHRFLPPGLAAEPVAGILAHATMLQELLGLPNLVGVFWTLSFEMVFYLVVSGLFVFGLHRRPAWCAVGLAVLALAGGRALPDGAFTTGRLGPPVVVAALVTVTVAGSVWAYVTGRRTLALVAGAAGAGMIALPALNGAPVAHSHAAGSWQALTFLTLMFSGSVIYAAQHGRMPRRAAALALGAVLACLLLAAWWHTPRPGLAADAADRARGVAVGTLLAVVLTFAIGYALRHRRFPVWMTWPGQVSYSVYLLHPLVLWLLTPLLDQWRGAPLPAKAAAVAGYLAVSLVVAGLAYRWVERPGQALGKRVARAVERRARRPVPQQAPPA